MTTQRVNLLECRDNADKFDGEEKIGENNDDNHKYHSKPKTILCTALQKVLNGKEKLLVIENYLCIFDRHGSLKTK